MAFTYPPLPPGDSLRIVVLSPGNFWAPLEGELEAMPFSAKPKYLALSYMWRDPDVQHTRIPAMPPPLATDSAESSPSSQEEQLCHITLNGQRLELFHNVTLALRFLRSETHALRIWVDAICINQQSIPERNSQVSLMAFIFSRAVGVVSWLGVDPEAEGIPVADAGDAVDYARAWHVLGRLWERGQSKEMAARLAEKPASAGGPEGGGPFGFANPGPTAGTHPLWRRVARGATPKCVQGNPYWRRLWVVQEVCLPRHPVFVCGGEVWPEAAVRRMLSEAERLPGRVVEAPGTATLDAAMQKLLGTRQERFSEKMRLEVLIERFADHGCVNVRDRIYGLVGLANDVDSFAPPDSASLDAASLASHSFFTGGPDTAAPAALCDRTGRSAIRVDYTRPFYDIWKDLVLHMYFQAKPLRDFGKGEAELEDERASRLVRFAGVVQKALENRVEEERPRAEEELRVDKELSSVEQELSKVEQEWLGVEEERGVKEEQLGAKEDQSGEEDEQSKEDEELFKTEEEISAEWRAAGLVRAKGYVAGTIIHLGPSYKEYVRSFSGQQAWIGSWDVYYEGDELSSLRELEDAYSHKIVDYGETELSRIRAIRDTDAVAWNALAQNPPVYRQPLAPLLFSSSEPEPDMDPEPDTDPEPALDSPSDDGPIRFLASDLTMGLAPPEAEEGDLVVRFWNCDAAILVRLRDDGWQPPDVSGMERRLGYTLVGRADIAEATEKRRRQGDSAGKSMIVSRSMRSGQVETKAAYVQMGFETLQKISAGITI